MDGERSAQPVKVRVADMYTAEKSEHQLKPLQAMIKRWSLVRSFAWYDLVVSFERDDTFRRRHAGHIETGRDKLSDPATGHRIGD